jgi:hypothetical protein
MVRAHWRGERSEAKLPLVGLKVIVRELNFAVVMVTFLGRYPDSVLLQKLQSETQGHIAEY